MAMRPPTFCAVALALTVSCSASPAPTVHAVSVSQVPSRQRALPHPPVQPCTLPSSAAALDVLRAGSDLVVVGDLSAAAYRDEEKTYLQLSKLSIVRVLESRSTPPGALTVITNGPRDHAIYPAGRYLMFLSAEGSAYSVTSGFQGALPDDRNDNVTERCVDQSGQARVSFASNPDGSTSSVQESIVASWISQRARPQRSGR